MDPQGNLTSGLGIDKNTLNTPFIMPWVERLTLRVYDRSSIGAWTGFKRFAGEPWSGRCRSRIGRCRRSTAYTKEPVKKRKEKYDFIIIDCPPARYVDDQFYDCGGHCLSANPMWIFALDGLSQLIYTINLIKKKLNKSLEIEGVVFTMYDARTNLSLEVVENVKNNLDQFIYKTIIPRNVRLAEAPSFDFLSTCMTAGHPVRRDIGILQTK